MFKATESNASNILMFHQVALSLIHVFPVTLDRATKVKKWPHPRLQNRTTANICLELCMSRNTGIAQRFN